MSALDGGHSMLGITLTPEQIRTAPVEVRRWITQEFARSMGLQPSESDVTQPGREHLIACSTEEALAVLAVIRDMWPVVNVFFELGRQGASFGSGGFEAFRLVDILHHTRLQNVDQVIACLNIINEAARRVTGDGAATLCALDDHGDCFIATQTQKSVLRVWQQSIAGEEIRDALDGAGLSTASPTSSSATPDTLYRDRFGTAAAGAGLQNRQTDDATHQRPDS
jgi:hypothetical protein